MANPALSRQEELLRMGFRRLNAFMLLVWRLGLGPWLNLWPAVFGRYMVLVHRGRKSGLLRYTPVNYCAVEGAVYCVSGFGGAADWYRNLLATPEVELWLPDGWWRGRAEELIAAEERLARMRDVLIASAFAARAAGIDPRRMSDADLARATPDYRVLRIVCTEPRTGPGGPGALAWVWPALVHLWLGVALLRVGRRRAHRRAQPAISAEA